MKRLFVLVIAFLICTISSAIWASTGESQEIAAPSDLNAKAISTSKISLSWDDNSDNETGFKIERKKAGGSYTQIATVKANTTTYAATDLSDNTKYYFRVRAYNTTGNSSYSNEDSATTGTVPAAPSDLTAKATSSSKIILSWDDNSKIETGFKIERKKAGGSYTQIATVKENTTTYAATGLSDSTKYYFRVRAYTTMGNSSYSNEDSATTGTVPAAPSDLTAKAASSSKINLSWDDNSDNESGFKIERKKVGGSYTQVATVKANTTTYAATGLSDNTKYYFRLRAYNSAENSSYSNEDSATTVEQTVISLVIGKSSYYVNSRLKTMDTESIIKDGRTLLPIRYVAEAIGAKVEWNTYEQKVTITMDGNKIELWLGKNVARFNGEYKLIDNQNPYVTPITVPPGRTMLPLRFVAENLGCQVDWNSNKKEVTVTYPVP